MSELINSELVGDTAQFFAQVSKICARCKCEKPISRFGKNNRAKDGLKYACYDCTNAASDAYRKKHPEIEQAKKAKFRTKHKTQIKAYQDKYRTENKEKCLASARRWRLENYEKQKAITARWQKNNPDVLRINNQNRRARKIANGGSVSRGIVKKLMVLQRSRCACCSIDLKKAGYHLDHIVAIAKGGQHADENIQLLCPQCNMSKHDKHPIDFMQSRGFLL